VPTATIRPHASAPWIRGNAKAAPVQPPSSASTAAFAIAEVAPRTVREYQPMRVLMSVLLRAAAATSISTSLAPGVGTGTEQ
jgi:hypothetical protein